MSDSHVVGAKVDEPGQDGHRPRRSRASLVVLGLAAALVLIGTVSVNVASADPSADDWLRLRQCESGNNYAINTGNGYYGAYQFDARTWRSVGGTGLPHEASPATQDALALALWQQRGWSPWVCAIRLGLPNGGSGSAPAVPRGYFDSIEVTGRNANVYGWAVDPSSSSASIPVHVYVNGAGYAFTADKDRADVNSALSISGRHGFAETIQLQPGGNSICVFAIGQTNNTLLECKTVQGPAWPAGWVDTMTVSGWNVSVSGWAFDPNNSGSSSNVQLNINGAFASGVVADQPRPDVNNVFGIGGQHGFTVTGRLAPGPNSVCAYSIGFSSSNNVQLQCQTINGPRPPIGYFDYATVSGLQANVVGWAIDPNNLGTSIPVHIYVNGAGSVATANGSRGDVNRAYGIGGNYGFNTTVQLQNGANTICVYAIGLAENNNTLLSCSNVQSGQAAQQRMLAVEPPTEETVAEAESAVTGPAPADSIAADTDPATSASAPSTTVAPTTTAEAPPTSLATETADSAPTTSANATAPPTTSSAAPVTPGSTATTTTATSSTADAGTQSSTPSTPIPSTGSTQSTGATTPAQPVVAKGEFDSLITNGPSWTLTGWIADPAAGPTGTKVRITINGVGHEVLANQERGDVAHTDGSPTPLGFVDILDLGQGRNEICVYAAGRDNAIESPPLTCRTEIVP